VIAEHTLPVKFMPVTNSLTSPSPNHEHLLILLGFSLYNTHFSILISLNPSVYMFNHTKSHNFSPKYLIFPKFFHKITQELPPLVVSQSIYVCVWQFSQLPLYPPSYIFFIFWVFFFQVLTHITVNFKPYHVKFH